MNEIDNKNINKSFKLKKRKAWNLNAKNKAKGKSSNIEVFVIFRVTDLCSDAHALQSQASGTRRWRNARFVRTRGKQTRVACVRK